MYPNPYLDQINRQGDWRANSYKSVPYRSSSRGYLGRKRPRLIKSSKKNLLFKKEAGPEYKNFDLANTNVVPTLLTGSTAILLNPIQAGTAGSTLTGRSCTLRSLNFKIGFKLTPTVVASMPSVISTNVRVVIIYDNACDGATPATADVFNTTANFQTPLNLANKDRFTVLSDQIQPMGVSTYLTGGVTYHNIGGVQSASGNIYKKMSLPFEGPSTAGAIAGIGRGAMFLYMFTEIASGSHNVVIDYFSRVRFTDI